MTAIPELGDARNFVLAKLKDLENKILSGALPAGTENATVADHFANYRAAVMHRRTLHSLLEQIDQIMQRGEVDDDELQEMPEDTGKDRK
jgi:hypothetical protein